MPFLAEKQVSVPNKDILSWIFDNTNVDPHKPVMENSHPGSFTTNASMDLQIYVDAKRPQRHITKAQGRIIIRKLAAGLHASGVRKGDCVCIHAFNDLYYPLLFLGILAVGGIFAGTNPSYTKFELVHHFKTARVTFLITEPELLGPALSAAEDRSVEIKKIWIFDSLNQEIPAGYSSWKTLMDYGERDWVRFDDEERSKSTTAARLFSSGTTGLPKAAALSHRNIIAQHMVVNETNRVPYETKRLIYLPMFHAATVPVCHATPLRIGDTTYILRRFELEPFIQAIEQHQITDLIFVPPVIVAILKYPHLKKQSLHSLRFAQAGAAPLSRENQVKMQALLSPEARLTQGWGMTETSCGACMFYYPEADDTGSVGRILPNLDVKIIDDNGKDITAYDIPGEMCVRGPSVISSYFSNTQATAESFDSEGYFKTGDVMTCLSTTKLWYITDRKKELIKVRGFQVPPAEIEGVLLTHPAILDAAVIGVQIPSDPDAEHPRAYVVTRPGAGAVTEESIREFCATRLAKYKELTGGVRFIEAIPRNATSKALKRILRDMATAESKLSPASKL